MLNKSTQWPTNVCLRVWTRGLSRLDQPAPLDLSLFRLRETQRVCDVVLLFKRAVVLRAPGAIGLAASCAGSTLRAPAASILAPTRLELAYKRGVRNSVVAIPRDGAVPAALLRGVGGGAPAPGGP